MSAGEQMLTQRSSGTAILAKLFSLPVGFAHPLRVALVKISQARWGVAGLERPPRFREKIALPLALFG
jgi:hypothetical protein